MPRTTRTFIALPLPGAVRSKLEALQRALGHEIARARWVGPDLLHLTLAFLGDVHDTDLNDICLAVAEAVRGRPPLSLEIRGLGAFPGPERPRALWAGVTGDTQALADVRRAVFDAATRAGYRPDEKFHPHITIARFNFNPGRGPDVHLQPFIEAYRAWSLGAFAADTVTTYASTLTPDGPAYAPLNRAKLAGKGRA